MNEWLWQNTSSLHQLIVHIGFMLGGVLDVLAAEEATVPYKKPSQRKLKYFCRAMRPDLFNTTWAESSDPLSKEEMWQDVQYATEVMCYNTDGFYAPESIAAKLRDGIRDILGNIYRPYLPPCPITPTVKEMAEGADASYDPKTWILDTAALHALTDALLEAGCPETEQIQEALRISVYSEPPNGWVVAEVNSFTTKQVKVYTSNNREKSLKWACKAYNIEMKTMLASASGRSNPRYFSAMGTKSKAATTLIIKHLRSRATHYRGCWAVDLLLGKD